MSEGHFADPRFDAFDLTDATYHEVDGHAVELSILHPKDLPAGPHPVIVRFHGGAFVTGSRLYPDWFPRWLLAYARAAGALLVTADYRLLPEADGHAVLADLQQLFGWLAAELPFKLSTLGLEADLRRVLLVGESAGAWLAAQAALLQPAWPAARHLRVCAAVLLYGMLDLKADYLATPHGRDVAGVPAPAEEVIERHLAHLAAGELPRVVSAGERSDLANAYLTRGRLLEAMGADSVLFPLENLERAEEGKVPPVWLVHGASDSIVPKENSTAFAEKLTALRPEADVLLTLEEGEEHGFDLECGLETRWIRDGLEFVGKYWP